MELFKLFGTIAVNNNDANSAIDETTGRAEKSEGRMTAAFKKIGAAVATYFAVDKIKQFGQAIVDAAAEIGAEQSAFEQIMGEYSATAQQKVNEIADATGMVSTRLTPYMTSMTAKFKGLGYDIDDATTLASDGLNLAADASAFWDKSLDDSMSALNSFINGSYEGGEAIGLFANDTQMASYAVSEGIVKQTKDWANLDEATKQATRLEYAQKMFEMSGATGQAAKEADQYANVQANLNEKWRQFKAQIGEPLLQNVVLPAMEKLSTLVDTASQKFQELKTWVSENQDTLQTLKGIIENVATVVGIAAAAFVGLKAGMAIQGVVQAFQGAQVALSLFSMQAGGATIAQGLLNGTLTIGEGIVALLTGKMTLASFAQALMTKGQMALNAVMAANPIALVVMAIVALIAIFVVLWNKCEWFRDFWTGLWDGIKEAAKAVADWFVQAWESIGTFFTETVPGWFNSFKDFFMNLWTSITDFLSPIWETIKNIVKVGLMFLGSLIDAAFQIITLPFRFIWENCKDTLISIWEAIKNAVSKAINAVKDVITKVMDAIKKVFTTVWDAIKKVFTTVWDAIKAFIQREIDGWKNIITTAMNAIKSVFTTVWNAIKGVVTTVWNGIKSTITTVVNAVKTTISNVFNSIKSAISTPLNAAKSTVSNIFGGIKSTISDKIDAAKRAVSKGLDAIKGFFNTLKLKFPNIKLPHFKISGSFSLNPPSVPKLGIDWYAKAMDNAMLLNSPTIFGMNPSGQLMGGGEAGQEVVAGSQTLMGMIREAVQGENSRLADSFEKLISMLAEYMPEIVSGMDRQLVLDSGALVGQLAPKMDSRLGDINRLRERGR